MLLSTSFDVYNAFSGKGEKSEWSSARGHFVSARDDYHLYLVKSVITKLNDPVSAKRAAESKKDLRVLHFMQNC